MLTESPMEDMEEETEEVIDDTALRGLAPLRKLEPNMPDDLLAVSFGSCRNLDSKRLRDEGLRPGEGLPAGPWLKASTVRLLLRPVGPLEAPTGWDCCWASDSEGLRAAAAPPGCLLCALDIAAASCLLSSSLSSLGLTGVPSGTRTKPPFPSGASPSGSPDSGPSPPSRLASFPMIDPSRPLYSDQCTIRAVSAFLSPKCAAKTVFLGVSEHLR